MLAELVEPGISISGSSPDWWVCIIGGTPTKEQDCVPYGKFPAGIGDCGIGGTPGS
ncbi:MAG: hypothetical protein HXS41_08900 [Theionarchaea archaeon]|nr:hypothetical protein [Theionarchaea archaeon]MBU7001578.1 hypothetical protein [Theionarchaea archaeon]MBU7021164.1 hypothetical protein [Theionarchaea archaeon]MBU7033892.1 hypothetical protein [Theionarchaea archaeon]MBU7040576.1 hypothetical protein [Theionarchaea archaeon]